VPAREPILAVGPHLKNTFTLAEGDAAWVSPHVGDLENLETLEAFRDALDRFRALFRIEPRRVARDLHPGYLSTRLAREWADERGLPEPETVQHHHAHVAAVAGEHGMQGPVVGISFDGTGYGEDGRVWGAEILVADLRGYRRVARSRYAPLPGGDLAVRRPWRTAAGFRALAAGEEAAFDAAFESIPDAELQLVETQTRRGLNAPMASSMGRVFDAASAVLGLRRTCRYEGQAAMELEALAWSATVPPGEPAPASGPEILSRAAGAPRLPFPERREDGLRVMDPLPLLVEIGRARAAGADPAELAVGFHLAVAERAVTTAADVAREEGLEVVALSGGTFQNAWLAPVVRALLEDRGIRVLSARQLGPNDGSISYGQAVVAAARQQESGR
jgi:hydrogenase maturation protein HypF